MQRAIFLKNRPRLLTEQAVYDMINYNNHLERR